MPGDIHYFSSENDLDALLPGFAMLSKNFYPGLDRDAERER